MKNRHVILILLFGVGLALILWLFNTTTKRPVQSVTNTQFSESSTTGSGNTEVETISAETSSVLSNASSEQRPEGIPPNRATAYPDNAFDDWRTPIEFYGKVIDENDAPVENARIDFGWNNLSGSPSRVSQSDKDGLFSLRGEQGKILVVKVSKAGYYTSRSNRNSFFYAGENENFVPNIYEPVVFRLKKKGTGEELITSKNGIRQDLALRVSRDGSPMKISLLGKRTDPNGELTISQLKPARELSRQTSEWSFEMDILDGGFIEHTDEFPFAAPLEGYQSRISLLFKRGEPNWTTHLNKSYFITFGEPRKYGWLRVETDVSQETVFVQYAINPSGSRNLEPRQ